MSLLDVVTYSTPGCRLWRVAESLLVRVGTMEGTAVRFIR